MKSTIGVRSVELAPIQGMTIVEHSKGLPQTNDVLVQESNV